MNEKSYRGNAKKIRELSQLAALRLEHDLSTLENYYEQPENIGCGLDFKEYVSPWTKGANNVDCEIFLVAQDWSSIDRLKTASPDELDELRKHGQLRSLPTNKNLCHFLDESFGVTFEECFATNAFVFLKQGSISARIPASDLKASITDYALPQIEIVKPRVALCLGAGVFSAVEQVLRRDMNHPKKVNWKKSISNPLKFGQTQIVGLPHPGGRATAIHKGKDNVLSFWRAAAKMRQSDRFLRT